MTYGVKLRAVCQVWHVGTHFLFLFSIYFENHGVQAVPFNFSRRPILHMWPVNTSAKKVGAKGLTGTCFSSCQL